MIVVCLFTLNNIFAQTKQAQCCKDSSSCCAQQKCCKDECKKDCCKQSGKKDGMACCNKSATGNEVAASAIGSVAMSDKNCCCNKKGDAVSSKCCKDASCCK